MSNPIIDSHYINLISSRLELFTSPRKDLYNCRCPLCGDSKTRKHAKRFYIRLDSDKWFTYCHNCGHNTPFNAFLKVFDENLYQQYRIDSFDPDNSRHSRRKKKKEKVGATFSTGNKRALPKPNVSLKPDIIHKVSDLPEDHPVNLYIASRKTPKSISNGLFFTEDFREFASQFRPDVSERLRRKDKRLIIPFYDESGKLTMFQGRTLEPDVTPKYITIKTDDDLPKLYGLHNLDSNKPIRVVEGVPDSWFVDNCVATCDSSLTSFKNGDVYIWDNQPRNREVVKKMDDAIRSGFRIVIWPKIVANFKDINDMILGGLSICDIDNVINENTFQGLHALKHFNDWQRF